MDNENKVGRPPKYETPEEMQTAIDEYFAERVPKLLKDNDGKAITDKKGNAIWDMNPPSITGLALHLEFESRQSMYDYELKKGFTYTIKRARLKCENYAEDGLLSNNIHPASGIFILKNYNWTDKQEIDQTTSIRLIFDKQDENV